MKLWTDSCYSRGWLTTFIRKHDRHGQISEADTLWKVIAEASARYQIPTLTKAIIDLFITFYKRAPAEGDRAFAVELMDQEEWSVPLHFLAQAIALASTDLLLFLETQFLTIVVKFAKSEQWRDSPGIVELITDLLAATGEEKKLKQPFASLCFTLLKDEACPVRQAAARQW